MKRVMRFTKKDKLSPRYMDPCDVLQHVGKISYELKLPSELYSFYLEFPVSTLKKCIGNSMSILPMVRCG